MAMSGVKRVAVACLMGAAAMAGCDQTPRSAREAMAMYEGGNYGAAAAALQPATVKKDENFVLSNCRFGSAALASGNLAAAEQAFLAAYEVINSVGTNDGGRTMGASIVFEGIKVWKGEPFERAMTDYYLGMIYLIQNDYGNARAAFQNSIFKVREYANADKPEDYREVESTFALGYFGLGLANLRLGKSELAETAFKSAVQYNPGLQQAAEDAMKPGMNTFIFVDAGMGPKKAGKGWYNEESAFGPTPNEVGPMPPLVAYVDGQPVTAQNANYATVDTLAMAQEKKWQDIDTLKKVKAVVGTGMMAAGTGVAAYGAQRHDTNTALVGLGILAAGALVSASSQSDLRSWDMLPRTVYIVPAMLPPGEHEIMVSAGFSQSLPLRTMIKASEPGKVVDNVVYFRVR